MTVSSISFLACPFSFMKVRDILPGCLSNCLSTLEPATHALLRIFYADSFFACSRAPQKACSHYVRKRNTFDGCFICFEPYSFLSASAAFWLDSEYMLCQQTGLFLFGHESVMYFCLTPVWCTHGILGSTSSVFKPVVPIRRIHMNSQSFSLPFPFIPPLLIPPSLFPHCLSFSLCLSISWIFLGVKYYLPFQKCISSNERELTLLVTG